MKDRPVVEWRVNSGMSWMGLIVGIVVIVATVVFSGGNLLPALYVAGVASAVVVVALVHLIVRKRRPLRVATFKQSSTITDAKITGVREKRRVDIDVSPLSLLDGSSGISFPRVVSFEVQDARGHLMTSRPTNVPSVLSERYVGLPVSVYVSPVSDERYVDVESLPAFSPMDAITSAMKGK